jgi:hypothetical protein
MYVDNQSIMSMVDEWKVGDRTKHMNVRYHYLREKVIHEEVILWKVHTDFNTADFLTKPLERATYQTHRESCMHGLVVNSRTSRDSTLSKVKHSIEMVTASVSEGTEPLELNNLGKRKGIIDEDELSRPRKYIRG